MTGRDWQAFDAELRYRASEIAAELLGKPSLRAGGEWRWGRKGSLAVVVAGAKAGMWFDHEAGTGGGLVDLVARTRGLSRREALDWTADRIGLADDIAPRRQPANRAKRPAADIPETVSRAAPQTAQTEPTSPAAEQKAIAADAAAARAARLWEAAHRAPADHPYLRRKQVGPNGLRCDTFGNLIVPLRDAEGVLRTIETITPEGVKRYLAGGAKAGHFCAIGGALTAADSFLICEGWATGASLHEATGLPVVAAMDAGNLGPVADHLRRTYPDAVITIVADNDDKPGRDSNPGVTAATKAAVAIDARLAVPPASGDANDLAILQGVHAVAAMVASAAFVPPPAPTHPEPALTPEAARAALAQALQAFMAEVPVYWRAVAEAEAVAEEAPASIDPLDFNAAPVVPPLLGLPVDVGLGKTSSARAAIAELLASGALGARKVAYAVPRHDLGQEQVEAFEALGLRAMLWKGRSAPDPTPENPEQLMCLDTEATLEALSAALTGQTPVAASKDEGWWYGTQQRRIRLEGSKSHAVPGEAHADLTAEAIRWSICEAELIQAMGRGRGVNRTAGTPLQIDLLTDVVLPVTVSELIGWRELCPSRRDRMALRGVVLENAADMAACFPDLWANRDAAKKDAQRRGTATGPRAPVGSCVPRPSTSRSFRTRKPG